MDGGPFRFNFQVDGVKDAEEGEGEGEGKGRGSAGERDKKTDKVEAEELELAPLVQDNELEQDSRNSDCYAQERLSETISLWKVVKLSQSELVQGLDETTDLVPGRYEGGFKVWECSVDLCQYLVDSFSLKELRDRHVLELGCGQGLPGILCLLGGAKQVVFQDFNKEVLQGVTHPCVAKNIHSSAPPFQGGGHGLARFLSGDWGGCSTFLDKHQFDLILTAETIYEPKSVPDLLELLTWCLNPDRGVALVASKVYYFGVGGGVGPFEEAVKMQGIFDLKHVFSVDDGASNMREILMLTWKKKS